MSPTTAENASTAAPSMTVGAQLHNSPAVRAAIKTIVDEQQRLAAQLTDVRPPNPGLKASYEELMARAAAARGRPLLYPYLGSGLGHGPLVELSDGSVKWDMITGIGVHFFGHSDADLTHAALAGAVDDTVKHGNLQSGFEAYEFAETFLKLAARNSKLKHAYVSTSGAMCNENALKVCYQKHAPANRVLAFQDCFMGRSNVMAQIGDSHDGRIGLPINVLVDYMPFYDQTAVDRMGGGAHGKKRFIDMAVSHLEQYIHRYPGQHACFIMELIQGEGGFNVGDRDYFKALIDVCKAHKIAVWDDEIQTFGRTQGLFAYEYFNLGEYVDVFCVGKMTQGCITAWTEEYNPKPGLLSGTFTGEGGSFRVGTRVLERLGSGSINGQPIYGEQGLFAQHHAAFSREVKALAARRPEWFPPVVGLNGPLVSDIVGGVGGMMRFTPYGGNKDKILKAAKALFEEGVIVFYCGHGPYHVRMLPPLPSMTLDMWPKVFAAVERGMAKAGV